MIDWNNFSRNNKDDEDEEKKKHVSKIDWDNFNDSKNVFSDMDGFITDQNQIKKQINSILNKSKENTENKNNSIQALNPNKESIVDNNNDNENEEKDDIKINKNQLKPIDEKEIKSKTNVVNVPSSNQTNNKAITSFRVPNNSTFKVDVDIPDSKNDSSSDTLNFTPMSLTEIEEIKDRNQKIENRRL